MRIVSTVLIIFLSCAVLLAQDKKVTFDNGTVVDFSDTHEINPDCRDSDSYLMTDGIVRAIIEDGAFMFLDVEVENDDENENETVRLKIAGVKDFKPSVKDNDFFAFNLLGQKVTIVGNRFDDREFLGIVNTYAPNKIGEVNKYILKHGIGKYAEPEAHHVPNSIICGYPEIEAQAKAKKLGIWAK